MDHDVPGHFDRCSASLQASEPYANFKDDSRYALRAQVPAGLNRKEAEIYSRLDPERLPHHIAIIMDGNGRWARRRNLPRVAGHKAGMDPVRSTIETCTRLGIQALTLYAFSAENWKRPPVEVDMLWRLLRLYLSRELPDLLRNGIRFTCMGRLDQLPAAVRQEVETAIERTAHNSGMRLNVAINYSGRAELVDAINSIVEDARLKGRLRDLHIDEQAISSRLYTAGLPDPDLLIRTSGEMRISNFLLWQIAYAELYVTETLWPDFRRTDLLEAVLDYQKRDRRFGGLSPEGAADHEWVEMVGSLAPGPLA
jgi:undecaprenyl diphosphate synthase